MQLRSYTLFLQVWWNLSFWNLLSLPPEAQIHSVFHVSLLKKCIGDPEQQSIPLPLLMSDTGPIYQPREILNVRSTLHSTGFQPEILVSWDGPMEPTWEPLSQFAELYPHFDLEGKVILKEGGNVILCHKDNHNQPTVYDVSCNNPR
ncbi:Chromo-like domain superfamily [Sesbania bispinosa]|nr:Chromo-like domain superfamily [Sesbania bispinosa]